MKKTYIGSKYFFVCYSTLKQLKVDIERKGEEKVIDFNGWLLITKKDNKKYKYCLFKGEISRTLVVED